MPECILITGGTGKFGRRFVEHFCAKGLFVVFTSTSADKARDLQQSMGGGGAALGVVVDFGEPSAVGALLKKLQDRDIVVNHLVNNARSMAFLQTDRNGVTTRDDFIGEYLLDVVVPYELSIGLSEIQPESLLTITNISSQYGVVAANPSLYDNQVKTSPINYGLAKAALNHLTKELAVRLASRGTRVNAIAYGGVEGRTDDEFKARYSRLTPSGRMLSEEQLPGPVDFLTSTVSSAMTGHILQADGGWTIW